MDVNVRWRWASGGLPFRSNGNHFLVAWTRVLTAFEAVPQSPSRPRMSCPCPTDGQSVFTEKLLWHLLPLRDDLEFLCRCSTRLSSRSSRGAESGISRRPFVSWSSPSDMRTLSHADYLERDKTWRSMPPPKAHLFCGLVGVGKTTLARQIAEEETAVRFSLDEWMFRLYGQLHYDDPSYVSRLDECKDLIWDTARQVIATRRDVVIDWNHWSRERRSQSASRARAAGAVPLLHFVNIPLDVAISRAVGRSDSDPFSHRLDEAAVRHMATIFEPPTEAEGIDIVVHS
jgi:predicted kinase